MFPNKFATKRKYQYHLLNILMNVTYERYAVIGSDPPGN